MTAVLIQPCKAACRLERCLTYYFDFAFLHNAIKTLLGQYHLRIFPIQGGRYVWLNSSVTTGYVTLQYNYTNLQPSRLSRASFVDTKIGVEHDREVASISQFAQSHTQD